MKPESKICEVCKKPFYRRIKSGIKHRDFENVRPIGSKTCSPNCSKIYGKRLKGRWRGVRKAQKNE